VLREHCRRILFGADHHGEILHFLAWLGRQARFLDVVAVRENTTRILQTPSMIAAALKMGPRAAATKQAEPAVLPRCLPGPFPPTGKLSATGGACSKARRTPFEFSKKDKRCSKASLALGEPFLRPRVPRESRNSKLFVLPQCRCFRKLAQSQGASKDCAIASHQDHSGHQPEPSTRGTAFCTMHGQSSELSSHQSLAARLTVATCHRS